MALTLSQNRPAGRTERSDGAVGTLSGTILSWMEWFQPPSQKHKLILKKKKKQESLDELQLLHMHAATTIFVLPI